MTITGVKDGMFQVSSWGKTFYVNPADYTNATDGRRMDFSRLSFT